MSPQQAGFLVRWAADWPDLSAHRIALSGDVHQNPGPSLRILQLNINRWRKHQPALEQFLRENDPDVVVLQETKLTTNVATPKIRGYVTHREDRTVHRVGIRPNGAALPPQGGLATLVKEGVVHQRAALPDLPAGAALERLAITVHLPPRETVEMVNLYRPPARAAADDHRDAGLHLGSWPTTPDTIICADVNGHGSWDPDHDQDDIGLALDEWLADHHMVTLNTGDPTRISAAGAGSAPDVTLGHGRLVNRLTWRTDRSIGSDHLPIVIGLSVGAPARTPKPRPHFNYRRALWPEFKRKVTNLLSGGGQPWTADS